MLREDGEGRRGAKEDEEDERGRKKVEEGSLTSTYSVVPYSGSMIRVNTSMTALKHAKLLLGSSLCPSFSSRQRADVSRGPRGNLDPGPKAPLLETY